MLHLVDGGQLHTVTFELDGHAHLPARVETAHIGAATTHSARRFRRPYLVDQDSRPAVQIQPAVPDGQLAFMQHRDSPKAVPALRMRALTCSASNPVA